VDIAVGVVKSLRGFSIKVVNKENHFIAVSGDVSLFSWGEDVEVKFTELGNNVIEIGVFSAAKVLVTLGKNKRNIDKLLNAIRDGLKEYIIE
jgi:uncharacterized protein (DUF1499 family)